MFHSLKVKFVAALVLLVSVVIGLSTWWNLTLHRDHMLQATQDKVRALAEAIERGIQVAMSQGQTLEVQRILEEIARDPDVEQILIFDNQGTILRSSKPELVGRRLDRDRLSRYVVQPDVSVTGQYVDGELVQSVVKKIRNRPECFACHGSAPGVIGTLHVDMSFRRTQAQIAEMERSAAWTVILAAAALAAGGGLLMTRLVDRRITRLVQAMAKVEGGDLETRANLGTRDELGRLADSFNAMVEKLKAARAEIEVYHQHRLDRAERLATLGEIAASLAHEIKNPLAGIAGAVQVMADELPEADPRKEIMHEILTQVHRLDRTVQDLLAFARPGKPDVEPCDIHQVLDRVLILLTENPEAKQMRVVRAYQPGLPRVHGDGKQLRQVFLNLILNAVQAMPAGGQITLRTAVHNGSGAGGAETSAPGPMVEVAVTDTGSGIPPNILKDLFTPFLTTKRRGTGLGLSVSRRIVEDHGGWITAESPAGQGATFRVFLPVESSSHRTGERVS
jgi:signal transduction histidine kinase